jgi:type I pantothenate kinase
VKRRRRGRKKDKEHEEEAGSEQILPFSPYRTFTRDQWARLRADTPMTLQPSELEQLSGIIEEISVEEVEQVFLPLSRLLNLYVAAAQKLYSVSSQFLGRNDTKVPFIIGVSGSVAVGKSTSARVLKALLARWPDHPRVDLTTTDGFLLPNSELERLGLMERKGFPESFDTPRLLKFLGDVKSGVARVAAPVYSHFKYDVLPSREVYVEQPDILIIEGLNILQPGDMPKDGGKVPFVSDFIDFSIYIDADPTIIEKWYLTRFMRLRSTAFRDPDAYFHKYAKMLEDEVRGTAMGIWRDINLKNLEENILPTRRRADLILRKGESHRVETVYLRKL